MCLVYLYLSAYGIFYCLSKPSLDITSSDELSIVQRSIVLLLCVGWLFFSWLFFFSINYHSFCLGPRARIWNSSWHERISNWGRNRHSLKVEMGNRTREDYFGFRKGVSDSDATWNKIISLIPLVSMTSSTFSKG